MELQDTYLKNSKKTAQIEQEIIDIAIANKLSLAELYTLFKDILDKIQFSPLGNYPKVASPD